MPRQVHIVGGGLAGTEAALLLAFPLLGGGMIDLEDVQVRVGVAMGEGVQTCKHQVQPLVRQWCLVRSVEAEAVPPAVGERPDRLRLLTRRRELP